jgi:hypothetical protein
MNPPAEIENRRNNMFRSTRSFNRLILFVALFFVLALGAAAFLLTHPSKPIPVTGANSANKVASVANPASSHQKIDLGAGYWLETDAQGGRIIPPETIIKYPDQTFDLGAGYTLVITASGGQIFPPARPSTYYQRTDLGDGYVLEVTPEGGQIIAPPSSLKVQPASIQTTTLDLGAGYQLIVGPAGGQIVPPNNPVKAPAEQKVDLGGGYWLVIGPDGGQVVPEGSR